jgi:uncharacterized protein YkuJ
MITILIEDIKDIVVDASQTEVKVDYIGKTGAVIARVEMSRSDKEFEVQQTQEALGKL